ncbi:hypothetical protein DL766_003684 [Monosporascus sp. MC13-8B]|uniref:Large ribosomal subunit protein uL6 alpha-beta domain-containing protein n=1 Tax=Monosporascus cannonballus TaxID=155416 RepID=A0ABY0HGG2_9PEZI|nr:hypothetical protein DL762_001867 [Monosporascus cannonballus]RYO98287.1 hypothetical protein DL763_002298 [Monosporascus cannonballus]RYP33052.1 hypothetical protein DL766_003684 [Monosporascus sp. MC13-8B]
MLAPSRGWVLEKRAAASFVTLPSFLLPAFQSSTTATACSSSSTHSSAATRRQFSNTANRPSKLGRTPISIPPGVEILIGEPRVKKDPTTYLRIPKRTVTVQGPLGKLDLEIPPYLKIDHDAEARRAVLTIENGEEKQQNEMWGTTWAYLQRHIMGVSEGHTTILRLVGVGYRASVEDRPRKAEYPGQKFVCLKLGFTHPVEEPVPRGMKASTPQPTRILLEGINREEVMSFAARIRRWRRPEPYKGKGIFVNDETIKLKQKKIK